MGRCPALKLLEQLRLQTINTLKWHLLSKRGFFNIWRSPNKLCTGHLRFAPGTILPRVSERHEHLWAKVQHDVWTSLKCAPNVLMLSLSSFETQSMQIAMSLCLLNLERIRTLHNGYPWLALLWGDIIKSSMQIQITRIGSGCRYYKACTTCNATEYLVLFWVFQSEFGTQKPDVVNASSSSLLLVPLMLLNSKETVFYMLEKRLRKRR